MSANVVITCDGNKCTNRISNSGTTDDVQGLLEWNEWHIDPTTDEYHYCVGCWPAVKAEYDDIKLEKELSTNE